MNDKHMEAARELFNSLSMVMPECSDGDDAEHEMRKIARALAAAEREGMVRAAEIAADTASKSERDGQSLIAWAVIAILAEAGES